MKKFKVLLVSFLFVVFVLGFSTSCKQPEETKPVFKLATVMPGSIQDADYNTIGYIATQEIGDEFGIEKAYSEKVAVPDVERVIKEYISDGYNIIWVHGNQFNSAALKVADENPDVTFIIEVDSEPTDMKPNVWYFHRNFHRGLNRRRCSIEIPLTLQRKNCDNSNPEYAVSFQFCKFTDNNDRIMTTKPK